MATRSIVNVASVTSSDHENLKLIALDPANDTVVAGTVSPQVAKIACKSFAKLPRIVTVRNVGIQISEDPFTAFGTHFAHLLDSSVGEFIVPAHA